MIYYKKIRRKLLRIYIVSNFAFHDFTIYFLIFSEFTDEV